MAGPEQSPGRGRELPNTGKAETHSSALPTRMTVTHSSSTREAYLELARKHFEHHPGQPMSHKDTAGKLGITKQAVHQLRERLRNDGFEVPLSSNEHAKIERNAKQEERLRRIEAERRELEEIKNLRLTRGLGSREIADILEISSKRVGARLDKSFETEPDLRLKQPRKPRSEMLEFDKDVASYYRQGFTYNEIAWIMDVNYSLVSASLERAASKKLIKRRGKQRICN